MVYTYVRGMHEMRSRIRIESIRKCRAYDFEDPLYSRFSAISIIVLNMLFVQQQQKHWESVIGMQIRSRLPL